MDHEIIVKKNSLPTLQHAFLSGEAGIENNTIDNSAAYIKFWLDRLTQMLKEENKAFVRASAQAQKATDFILNRIEESALQE